MNTKMITCMVAAALLSNAYLAEAQKTGKVFRIGFLDASTVSGSAVLVEPFRQELSKLGWIEGKSIAFEYRFAEGQPERLPELAAELVRLRVDLIVVAGIGAALAAKSVTASIPIVMASAGDPVGAGLVASLAQPGGNVTGLSTLAPDLDTKRIEVLKDAVPKLVRVGLLLTPTAGLVGDRSLKDLRVTALSLKLKLEEIDTQLGTNGLESAFQNRKAETGGRDYVAGQSTLCRRKKANRRAGCKISIACYLPTEGVRR